MQQGWNNVLVFWEIWVLFLSNFERLTYSFVEVWGIVGQDARQILRYLHTFFVVVDFREKYILFCRILGECQPRCYFGGIYVLFVVKFQEIYLRCCRILSEPKSEYHPCHTKSQQQEIGVKNRDPLKTSKSSSSFFSLSFSLMSLLSFSSLSFSFRCCINCNCLCCQFLHCNYYLLCS